jgi:hypothetical protein
LFTTFEQLEAGNICGEPKTASLRMAVTPDHATPLLKRHATPRHDAPIFEASMLQFRRRLLGYFGHQLSTARYSRLP